MERKGGGGVGIRTAEKTEPGEREQKLDEIRI